MATMAWPGMTGDRTIPPRLAESVRRHHAHLVDLVVQLRRVGCDEATVAASVHRLVVSYEIELIAAIDAILMEEIDA